MPVGSLLAYAIAIALASLQRVRISIGLVTWGVTVAAFADDPFLPDVWRAKKRIGVSQLELGQAHYVFGPMDACAIVELRSRVKDYVELGEAVPSDMFILSKGEPKDRGMTKIGGLPYWRIDREWPEGEDGNPIPFLAQFNLTNSRDIIGATEGDIALLFSHSNPLKGCVVRWENVADDAALVSMEDVPIDSEASAEFFGTRWRTANYPEWRRIRKQRTGSSWIKMDDGRIARGAYFIYELLGMQVSRSGFLPPGLSLDEGDEVICSLAGISIIPDRPHPLLNSADPISESQADKWFMSLSDIEDSSGYAVILIVRDSKGRYRCVHKNL